MSQAEDREKSVEQPVLCTIHHKPTIRFCLNCKILTCMTCTRTHHNNYHKTDTIKEALQKIEIDLADMDRHLTILGESMKKIDDQHKNTNITFHKLILHEKTPVAMRQMLEKRRVYEISKLMKTKVSLENKKTERENLKQNVNQMMSRECQGRLLTQLVQSELRSKLQEISEQNKHSLFVTVVQPSISSTEGELVGNISYKYFNRNLISDTTYPISDNISRYWNVDFENFFQKTFETVQEIAVPAECTRLAIIKEMVWLPMSSNNIHIYNNNGCYTKPISINWSRSVTEAHNGDVIVACDSMRSGLHLITDEDKTREICVGNFSDVCSFRSKVYALAFEEQAVYEIRLDEDNVDEQMKWKIEKPIKLKTFRWDSCAHDTFLIDTFSNELYFYIMPRRMSRLYMFNERGGFVKIFVNIGISEPRLCGIDNNHNLLISDSNNKLYRVFNTRERKWRKDIKTDLKDKDICVYDIIQDSQGFVWQVGNYKLGKYTPK